MQHLLRACPFALPGATVEAPLITIRYIACCIHHLANRQITTLFASLLSTVSVSLNNSVRQVLHDAVSFQLDLLLLLF